MDKIGSMAYIVANMLSMAMYTGIPAALMTAGIEVYVKLRNKKRKQNEDYWNPRA